MDPNYVARHSDLSPDAPEFFPRSMRIGAMRIPKRHYISGGDAFFRVKTETEYIEGFRKVCRQIAASPSHVDECLPSLLAELDGVYPENVPMMMKHLAETIIEKAAIDMNGRHAIGRAVNVLLSHFKTLGDGQLADEFWKWFSDAVEKEQENAADTLAKNPLRYRNIAFSLCEVLGASWRMYGFQKADEVADYILTFINDFYETDDGEQWKRGGQVLKQVGSYLEDSFATRKDSKGKSSLDYFMEGLKWRGQVGESKGIPFYIRLMLVNILELRAYNWGRNATPQHGRGTTGTEVSKSDSSTDNDRGRLSQLNSEERMFLVNEGCISDGTGMDDEMEEDYRQFLRMTDQQ